MGNDYLQIPSLLIFPQEQPIIPISIAAHTQPQKLTIQIL